MTYDELVRKILEVLPESTFGEDFDGQLIIYTNKVVLSNGHLWDFDPEKEQD